MLGENETKRQFLQRQLSALETERTRYETDWRDLQEFILPWRGKFQPTDERKSRMGRRIINSAATKASRTLASGMLTGLTSPARPWFRLTTPDPGMMEFSPVKEWLHIVESRMRDVFARSNLYIELETAYRDLGVFGPAAILCEADTMDVIRFYGYEIGTYWFSTNDRAAVDTFARKYRMTIRQMIKQFGAERCSRAVRDAYDRGNLEEKRTIVQFVLPNHERAYGRADARGMAYSSCYYEEGGETNWSGEGQFLREAGFHEFPVLCPRWAATQADVYGWSAGMEAIGDVKQLQWNEKDKAAAIQKFADPPMVAPSSLNRAEVDLLPGQVTFVNATSGNVTLQPLYAPNPGGIQALREDNAEVAQRVREAFFEDLFLMLATRTGPEMTAKEIAERHEEKLMALGPILERLNTELLDPLIDRSFAVMLRHPSQMIPPPPEELQGMPLKVEYISILAQSQQMVATSSMERFTGFAMPLLQLDPQVADKIDFDQLIDEYGTGLGVPPSVIRSDDKVADMRAARQQQQAMAQAAAMAKPLADGAAAAKSLSEAVPTEDNALGRLAQAATGGAPMPV